MVRFASKFLAAAAMTATLVAGVTTGAQAATPAAHTAVAQGAVVAHGNGWEVVGSGYRLAAARPARAAGAGIDCGWFTCTLYIYRGTTHTIDGAVGRYANASVAAIAGAFAIACAPIGGVGAVVCAAIAAVVGGYAIDQFNYASGHDQCIAISYFALTPYNISPNNGGHCHN